MKIIPRNELIGTLNKIKDVSVLVIGDIMLDQFVYGNVDRVSPESPVPVLTVQRENEMLGGAGNTLSNLHALGVKAKIVSAVGNDKEGGRIRDILKSWNIRDDDIYLLKDRPTIVKTRFLAGHHQLLRADYENVQSIEPDIQNKVINSVEGLLSQTDAVIFSDYGKGLLTPHILSAVIHIANSKNIPVIVDPKGADYSIYQGADVITPNKKELSEVTRGMAVQTDDEILEASRCLIKDYKLSTIVATRSQDGMSVITPDSVTHIRSAGHIEVFDVSGAGDAVIATIASVLATGKDIVTAASLANIAGSIVVSKVGTAPIRHAELLGYVEENGARFLNPKNISSADRMKTAPILTWDEAKEEVLRWRARGLKVGFTNGCFDILHSGHVRYLNDARIKCDRLIVGLNKDKSIKILKGENRPVHDEESRVNVMSALGCVDMVVRFGAEKEEDDNTAGELLKVLQPDIYFKGGDYTIDQIPEALIVHKYGGQVDIMPVYDGHSTTESIQKITNKF